MLNIYKASAGSGKTHTLTRDYIFLSFSEPSRFMNILAVTFTNKAAGEMKERIIEELALLSINPTKSGFYEDIKHEFKLSEKIIALKSKANLTKLLHNYTFFSISTIDSFVQKVIRAFAFELQIPNSYNINLDIDKVSEDITNELIEGLDENKNLQNWLTLYAYEQMAQGKKWDFRENIIKFSKQLFKEDFYKIFDEIKISDKEFIDKMSDLLKKCYSIINKYEADFIILKQKGQKIIDKSGFNNVKGATIKYLRNLFFSDTFEISMNNTLQKAYDNNEWWSKSTKESVKSERRNTIDALVDLLNQLIDFEQDKGLDYFSAQVIKKNIFDFGVLNNLNNLLPEYRTKNNLLLISDVTLLLKKIIGNNDAPFIYEKIGNRYKNIMIDEFQDTSGFQWHNFKPLISNSLAFDNFNLIVGDVKQSIYRWRSGDWRLLHSKIKREIGKNYVNETSLDTNWRSKKEIINFNNSIFTVLPKILQNKANTEVEFSNELQELADILPQAYKDAVQKIASKNNSGGYVEIKFINDRSWKDIVDEEIPVLIDDLLEKGYSAGDIGILVRTNADANRIMQLLLNYISQLPENKRYNIISAESLLLSNSFAVKILVNVMNFIINPKNYIFLIEIITDIKRLNNEIIDEYKIFEIKSLEDAKYFLPDDFSSSFDKFINLSLYELIEKLISIFELNSYDNEIPFIRSFQEVISGFINNAGADIAGFLQFWDDNSHKLSVQLSDQKDAVQVMTIHKSKGLAFGIVIMPYIDWKMYPKAGNVIWVNTENSPFNEFKYFPLSFESKIAKSHFKNDYASEIIYSFMDTINMLYVAFTRAKERIYGFGKVSKNKDGQAISDYLYQAISESNKLISDSNLINLTEFWDSNELTFKMGDENKIFAKTSEQTKNFELLSYPSYDWTNNIAIIAHAEDLIAETVETRRNAMKHGIIMHQIFEKISSPNDIDKVINEFAEQGKLSDFDIEEIKRMFTKIFENKIVTSWFNDNWEVFSEKEILTRYGTTKIPDRVIANDKEIIVIDYKFGSKRPEHKRQIKTYSSLLKDIYPNKSISAYLLYVEKNIIEKV